MRYFSMVRHYDLSSFTTSMILQLLASILICGVREYVRYVKAINDIAALEEKNSLKNLLMAAIRSDCTHAYGAEATRD